jgi:HEAT repeat protein
MRPLSLLLAAFAGAVLAAPAGALGQSFLGKTQREWIVRLDSNRPGVRRSAAFALGQMGQNAFGAIGPLTRRLEAETDPTVRAAVASALGDLTVDEAVRRIIWKDAGPTLQKLLETSGDAEVRRSAAYALGAVGEDAGPATGALTRALGDPNPMVKQNAAWALGRLGPAADPAVDDLVGLLTDPDALVRRDAAAALGGLSPEVGAKAVGPLLSLIASEKDPEGAVVENALNSLGQLAGPDHRDKADRLYPLLKSTSPDIRRQAALVLGKMGGEPAARGLPVLREALHSAAPDVRATVAAALGNIGPDAAEAIPDLAAALRDGKEDLTLRRNAALAIGHIGGGRLTARSGRLEKLLEKEGLPALVYGLAPTEPKEVRLYSSESLGQIGYPLTLPVLPALLRAIEHDRNHDVRQRCVWALFNVPKEDLKRTGGDKMLTRVLDETSSQASLVRWDTARALAFAFHEEAPPKTVDVLLEMLTSEGLRVFNQTDASVKAAGGEAASAGSAVAENLGGDARYMAAEALEQLGRLASQRPDVIDALKKAERDSDQRLEEAAGKALKALGAK